MFGGHICPDGTRLHGNQYCCVGACDDKGNCVGGCCQNSKGFDPEEARRLFYQCELGRSTDDLK